MSLDTYFSVHEYFDAPQPDGNYIPVMIHIGTETLTEELEMCLRTVSKGNFISHRNTSAAELMIYMLLDKLRILYQHDSSEARTAAERMIQILQDIDTDDDFFPSGQISTIRSIIQDK